MKSKEFTAPDYSRPEPSRDPYNPLEGPGDPPNREGLGWDDFPPQLTPEQETTRKKILSPDPVAATSSIVPPEFMKRLSDLRSDSAVFRLAASTMTALGYSYGDLFEQPGWRVVAVRKIPDSKDLLIFLNRARAQAKPLLPKFWHLAGMFGIGFGFGVMFFIAFRGM
jgi:hypothetical protein